MNHMNLFMPYEHHNEWHEDVLTRNFLYLLKSLPEMRELFFAFFANEYDLTVSDEFVNSIEVNTQVTSSEDFFDSIPDTAKVVSILISDDKFKSSKRVEFSERYARYDGVIRATDKAGSHWLFVVENKPRKENVRENQLDLNLGSASNRVHLNPKACCLSWRKIVEAIGNHLAKGSVSVPANALMNDFLEYVDANYPLLKPYDRFVKCGRSSSLVRRRCRDVLTDFANGIPAIWHKGWMYYAESGDDRLKKIGFDVEEGIDGEWQVSMWLFAGDTMNGARGFYESLDVDALQRILEEDRGFSVASNFHLSFVQTNLIWFKLANGIAPLDYAKYWCKNFKQINQVPKDDFSLSFERWRKLGFVADADRNLYLEKITSKAYEKVNLCPGFLIKYTWSKESAIALDNQGKFVDEFRRIKNLAFSVMR